MSNVTAQEEEPSIAGSGQTGQDGVVNYSADYFRRYQVYTALDMVNRVPGFTLDDGGDKRGFGGAAGNILINDRRPSTKQDAPSAILGRVSAEQVLRIELIRVRVRDIDLQGHTEVINVILREDAPATVRWEAYVRHNFESGSTPSLSMSLADRWKEIEYNVAFDITNSRFGDPGTIRYYAADGVLTEVRTDEDLGKGPTANLYLNTGTWVGQNFVQFNSRLNLEERDILQEAYRVPQAPGTDPRQEIIETFRRNKRLELGVDGERVLNSDLLGKAIVLYSLLDQNPSSSQRDLDASGQQTRFQLEDEDAKATEFIGRLEFDWAGLENHAVQLNMERALNTLDNAQVFTDDTGSGPVVIEIPGANTRVEEIRWNLQAQDTWSLGDFDLDYGLDWERSTISQSGDSNQERNFTFLKPRAILTWSPVQGQQTRVRFEREISQLNFEDFVSATVFEDDDVALGNPDLHPDSTWIAELSHERRFGDVGVVRLTGFHHWITDVLDLLPLTPTFEAPGNIGDGRRWGVILETTLPLDALAFSNAQLEFNVRWQDSTVVDPVTGLDRRLSGAGGFRGDVVFRDENRYAFEINFRQDIESQKLSWGWGLAERDRRVLYKANELDIFNEGYNLTAFVETTRWFGLKISLEGQNLLNTTVTRDRTIYELERDLTPIKRRELRDGINGQRVFFRVSGTF
jgi:hypothetical protein